MADIADTTDMKRSGNTSNRARIWVFTYFDEEKFDEMKDWTMKNCTVYSLNPEKCPKTERNHLQGYWEFKNARYFSALQKRFPGIHLEKAKSKEAALDYCMKSETRNGETFTNVRPKVKDPLDGKTLKPWQKDVVNLMKTEPDERTVYWYYDENGNNGKTTLAKHLCINYEGSVLYMTGKAADCKYGVTKFLEEKTNNLKMAIFDFARSQETYISYQAIEEIKNGIFYNTKYEAKMITYDCPHIVIFANFMPDKSKLSEDRWNIIAI